MELILIGIFSFDKVLNGGFLRGLMIFFVGKFWKW